MQKIKEKNAKRLFEGFDSMLVKANSSKNAVRSLGESLKTLRDLPLFGHLNFPIDFRFPSIADL